MPEAELAAGVAVLAQRYDVRVPDGVLSRAGFLAGDDDRRATEFAAALADPDVRAIFVARGGYGLTRILPRLDFAALAADPVPIVGFSDATALLAWAYSCGVRGIHGPVVSQLGRLPTGDIEWLFDLLENPGGSRVVEGEPSDGAAVAGPLLGGNLCLLTHLVGTPWAYDFAGAIPFIEDVGERPYRVDRQLTHLLTGSSLPEAAAVITGDFIRCTEPARADGTPSDHPTTESVIAERLGSAGLARVSIPGIGHGDRNRALPIGARAELDVAAGRLVIVEGAVS